MKKKIIIGAVLAIAIIGIGSSVYMKEKFLKDINKEELDTSLYINTVDEVSSNKAQINWKYVASISAVLNKNKLLNVSKEDVKQVANKFLAKDKLGNYKVYKLNDTISKFNLSKGEVKRVNDYIKDLENYGPMPSRLEPNGKYMKFIDSIKDSAVVNYKKYNILPSITISQAILESNWGESKLASKYNNLFGIKPGSNWKGETVTIETQEFYDQTIEDKFRVYKDADESIDDHAQVIYDNSRYADVMEQNTYLYQAKRLEQSGYSTAMDENGNRTYKNMLAQIIKQYNLQLIDSKLQEIDK